MLSEITHFCALELKLELVGDKRNKLRVRGLALGVGNVDVNSLKDKGPRQNSNVNLIR